MRHLVSVSVFLLCFFFGFGMMFYVIFVGDFLGRICDTRLCSALAAKGGRLNGGSVKTGLKYCFGGDNLFDVFFIFL